MKALVIFGQMAIILLNYSCTTSQHTSNDVSCLRKINTDITKELKRQIGNEYDLKKANIKLILKFYVNAKSKTDSIVIFKSNLKELSLDEKAFVKNLENYKYRCIREVYYNKELKPTSITVIFNPRLVN